MRPGRIANQDFISRESFDPFTIGAVAPLERPMPWKASKRAHEDWKTRSFARQQLAECKICRFRVFQKQVFGQLFISGRFLLPLRATFFSFSCGFQVSDIYKSNLFLAHRLCGVKVTGDVDRWWWWPAGYRANYLNDCLISIVIPKGFASGCESANGFFGHACYSGQCIGKLNYDRQPLMQSLMT